MKRAYTLPQRDRLRRNHVQLGTEPPGTYRDPTATSAPSCDGGQEQREHGGVVGEVGVHLAHDVVALVQRVTEPVAVGGAQAGLARSVQHLDAAQLLGRLLGQLAGAVGAVVVGDDDVQVGHRVTDGAQQTARCSPTPGTSARRGRQAPDKPTGGRGAGLKDSLRRAPRPPSAPEGSAAALQQLERVGVEHRAVAVPDHLVGLLGPPLGAVVGLVPAAPRVGQDQPVVALAARRPARSPPRRRSRGPSRCSGCRAPGPGTGGRRTRRCSWSATGPSVPTMSDSPGSTAGGQLVDHGLGVRRAVLRCRSRSVRPSLVTSNPNRLRPKVWPTRSA